ncbi:MAG TPA: 2TM domain-containing protein [Candidatus Lokiarchaeia archaeon]|nr:2TM domain-containing protein [Candidatus Lokiarchaeia archaeon]
MAESSQKTPFSDEELKHIAKKKIMASLAFRIHLLAFIGVNISLVLINYLTNHFSIIWYVYPLFGWLIGVAEHGASYLIYSRGVTGIQKIGVIMHAVAYITTTPALFIFNVVSSPAYPWYLWPACFWLVGLVIHAVVIRAFGARQVKTGEKKSWMDQKIEKELAKGTKQRGGK